MTKLAERRSEPRRLVREPAILQLLRPRSSERFKVYILDVSDGGFGIWTPVALQPGTLVKVRMPGSVVLTGEVRYTARSGDEFHAGVKLQDLHDGLNTGIIGNLVGPDELLLGSLPWGKAT